MKQIFPLYFSVKWSIMNVEEVHPRRRDKMVLTKVMKYRPYMRADKIGKCIECGGDALRLATTLDDLDIQICKTCLETIEATNLPYPYRVEFGRNLGHAIGGEHLDGGRHNLKGMSGSPVRSTRLDFRLHELYCTREAALREGWLK